MTALWDLDGVNTELSAAALDASRWKPTLQRLSDTVGAVGTVLLPPVGQRSVVISTDSLAGPNEQYIDGPWAMSIQRSIPQGPFVPGEKGIVVV